MPEYKDDPNGFTKEVSFGGMSPYAAAQQPAEDHYVAARRIIAISTELKNEKDRFILAQLLNVVQTAQERAFEDYRASAKDKNGDIAKTEELFKLNDEFYKGSEAIFNSMVDGLDPRWQALKVVYKMEPEKAIWYFNNGVLNEKKLERLLKDIDEVHTASSRKLLAQTRDFNKLPEDVKNQLIEQHAYLAKLNYDLLSIPTDNKDAQIIKIRQLSQQLNDNIQNSIKNNKSADDIAAESAYIRKQIEEEIKAIRSAKFKQQLTSNMYTPIGLGAAVWFTGLGVPTAIAMTAFSTLIKANVETSEARMTVPELDAAKQATIEAKSEDLAFINRAEAQWRKFDETAPADVKVNIRTIDDDAKEKAGDALAYVADKLKSPLSILRKMTYAAIIAVVIVTGLVFPYIYVGLAILAAATLVYATVNKMINRSQPAPTILGPIVDTGFEYAKAAGNAISKAANYVFGSFFKISPPLFNKPKVAEPSFSKLSPEALILLKAYSPVNGERLVNQLSRHFSQRLSSLIKHVENAKENGNPQEATNISPAIKKLEKDWEEIKQKSENPKDFCIAVEQYLERCYQTAKAEYLATKNENPNYDMSKEKKNMLFGKKPDANMPSFEMEFAVDYASKQKDIEELLELKSEMAKVRRDL